MHQEEAISHRTGSGRSSRCTSVVSQQPNICVTISNRHEKEATTQRQPQKSTLSPLSRNHLVLHDRMNNSTSSYSPSRDFQSRLVWQRYDLPATAHSAKYKVNPNGVARLVPMATSRSMPSVYGADRIDDDVDFVGQNLRYLQVAQWRQSAQNMRLRNQDYDHRCDKKYFMVGSKARISDRYHIDVDKFEMLKKNASKPPKRSQTTHERYLRSRGGKSNTVTSSSNRNISKSLDDVWLLDNGVKSKLKSKNPKLLALEEKKNYESAKKWGLIVEPVEIDPYAHKYQPSMPKPGFINLQTSSESESDSVRPSTAIFADLDFERDTQDLQISLVSDKQRQVFDDLFQQMDSDRSGSVSVEEVLDKLFAHTSKSDVKKLISVFDLNGDQTLDAREFSSICALNDKLRGTISQDSSSSLSFDMVSLEKHLTMYREIFEMIDQDGDHQIHLQEVMLLMSSSMNISLEENHLLASYILDTIHKDAQGFVDFASFLTCLPFFLHLHRSLMNQSEVSLRKIQESREQVRAKLHLENIKPNSDRVDMR